MSIAYSKNFLRQAKLLSPSARRKLLERLEVFSKDPLSPVLRNHQLKGRHRMYRSIDVTGDIRALYLPKAAEAIFDAVGTHGQLYG